MKRLLLALLFAASPAYGATYHVSPSGSDAADGRTPATAWRTIAAANARIAAGDTVRLAAGSYADMPAPAAAPTGGRSFRFLGEPGARIDHPNPAITSASYLVLEGLTFPRLTVQGSGHRDTLRRCVVEGAFTIDWVDYVTFDRCEFRGRGAQYIGGDASWDYSGRDVMRGVEFSNCTWTAAGADYPDSDPGGKCWVIGVATDSLRFLFNRVSLTLPNTAGPSRYFGLTNSTFRGNEWYIRSRWVRPPGGRNGMLYLRDRSSGNRFARERIIAEGSIDLELVNSGSFPGSCERNTWDSCLVVLPDGAVWIQDGLKALRFTRNLVIAPRTEALVATGTRAGSSFITGNTFLAGSRRVVDIADVNFWEGALTFGSNTLVSLQDVGGAHLAAFPPASRTGSLLAVSGTRWADGRPLAGLSALQLLELLADVGAPRLGPAPAIGWLR